MFGFVIPATCRNENLSRHYTNSVSRDGDTVLRKCAMVSDSVGADVMECAFGRMPSTVARSLEGLSSARHARAICRASR